MHVVWLISFLINVVVQSYSSDIWKFFSTTSNQLLGRNMYRVLVGKPKGRRPRERTRRRWEDGIKMDLREVGWGSVEWIHLAWDRDLWGAVVNAVMNFRVLAPWG
jgi:hypothetical protein